MIWPVVLLLIVISCIHVSSDCISEAIQELNITAGSVTATEEEIINDLDSFERLYESLKEYHENELKKLKIKYGLINSEKNDAQPVCTCNTTDNTITENCSNLQINNLQQKVDQIIETLSSKAEKKPNTPIHCPKPSAPVDCSTSQVFDKIEINKRTRGKFVGCFQDQVIHRGLKGYVRRSYSNTIESCIEICRNGHYVYAGLQASEWCFCDNIMQTPKNVRLDDSKCTSPCSGNKTQICGAGYINSIYETGVEQYLIDEAGRRLPDSYITPSPYSYWLNHESGKMHS